jgi:hypothetical protein
MMPTFRSASPRTIMLLLFVCSLLVKGAGVVYMNTNPNLSWNLVAPDTRGVYRPIAVNVAEGRGYQWGGSAAKATRVAPLFPLYLAGVYRLFGTDAPAWLFGLLHAVMRACVTVFVFLLASRAFGRGAGVAAAVIHAFDPWEAFWTPFVLKESLAVLVSVAAVVVFVRAVDRPTWWRAAGAGVLLGLAGLTRYASLGLVPWLLVLVVGFGIRRTRRRHALAVFSGLLIATCLTLAPWVYRNYEVYGRALVYTQFANYFFISNGPGAERAPETSGYSGASTGDRKQLRSLMLRKRVGSYTERDLMAVAGTGRYLLTHPGVAVRLVAARFINLWRPTFAGASMGNILALGVPYGLMMVAALAGLVRCVRRRREPDAEPGSWSPRSGRIVLCWILAFYVILHVLFWSEIRYRQYATPYLAAFAGYAIAALLAKYWRGGQAEPVAE